MAAADLSGMRLHYRFPPQSPRTEPNGCGQAKYLMGSVRRIASAVWPRKSHNERVALVLVACRFLSRVLLSAPPPRSSFCTAVAAVFATGKLEYCPRLTTTMILAVVSDLDQVLRCECCTKRHSDGEAFVSVLRTYIQLTRDCKFTEIARCKADAGKMIHAEEELLLITAGFDFDWDSDKITRKLSKAPSDRATLELFFSVADFASSSTELMPSASLEELARSIAAVATALGKQQQQQKPADFDPSGLRLPEQALLSAWLNRLV